MENGSGVTLCMFEFGRQGKSELYVRALAMASPILSVKTEPGLPAGIHLGCFLYLWGEFILVQAWCDASWNSS